MIGLGQRDTAWMSKRRRTLSFLRRPAAAWPKWAATGIGLLVLGGCQDRSKEACDIPTNFTWTSSDVLVAPISDPTHELVSIKDPTVVRFDDRWHIYATSANTDGEWSLVYLNFDTWENAPSAPLYHMDQTPGFAGYMAAPHVFYFSPQETWYLVFQTQPPAYATTKNIADPASWSAPKPFFAGKPRSAPELWIDYWVICDDVHCYLFFTGDNGGLYRSRTTREAFPEGMDEPVLAMRQAENDLFEGSATYKIDGMDKYLTLVEAIGPMGIRYYKAWTADTLDGAWTPIQSSFDRPFAGENNVTFPGQPWTRDISHGELVRKGHDERMEVDLCSGNMQFLYQGQNHEAGQAESEYSQKPYRLGLLTQGPSDPSIPPLDLPPTPAEPFPTIPTGDNLLVNPGFEEGTTGWMAWGSSLATVTSPVHGGASAGYVTDRSESWHGAAQEVYARVEPGATYFASIWVSIGGGTDEAEGTSGAMEGSSSGGAEAEGSSAGEGSSSTSAEQGEGSSGNGGGSSSAGAEEPGASSSTGEASSTSAEESADSESTSTSGSASAADGSEESTSEPPSVGAQPVSLTLKTTCGTEESYSGIATGEVGSGEWVELRGTFDVPTCPDLVEVILYVEGPAVGVDLYLDDGSLSK